MTHNTASRKLIGVKPSDVTEPPIANLSDVLAHIEAAAGLSPIRRRDMRSALSTLSRITARHLASIPANAKPLRTVLDRVSPALHNLSSGRWANIRSQCFKSLDMAGVARLPGRSSDRPSPGWNQLLAPLPNYPFRISLLLFARYCTRRGINPENLDQDTFDQFEQDLEEFASRSNPRQAFLSAARSWNKAGETFSHWPKFRVQVVDRRDHYALFWSAFPETLKADVDAMVAAALSPDILAPTSRRPIKLVSAESRVSLLRAFASAVVEMGRDPSTIRTIADLVSVDNAKLGLRFLLQRAGEKPTAHVHQHAKLLCTLAKHWADVPDDHLAELSAIRNRLNPGRHGMTEKNRATLRYFEDEAVIEKFLLLPENIRRRYGARALDNRVSAVKIQLALAIELLTVAPVRNKNLVNIRLGENLIDRGTGRRRRVHLYFPDEDVKNDQFVEFELLPPTITLLDFYMQSARPKLLRAASDYLFPGSKGGPKDGALLSEQIADLVECEVGVRLTSHQFRHLAGFLYLKENPGGHEVVRRLLGHKSIETTIRFYVGMEVQDAVRHYDDHIAKRRSELLGRGRGPRGGSR